MEFNIEIWLQEFTKKLFDEFGNRIKFIGLQGSYRRGEADENSDVDIVIILDKLSFEDLSQYKKVIHSMSFNEKVCGFISGEREIYNWPKFELFQFYNDTLPLHGDLKDFIPDITIGDIYDAIKINSSGIYHRLIHAYLFENKNPYILKEGYKSAFFLLQAIYYCKNSVYISSKRELLDKIINEDREILLVNLNWESLDIENNIDFYFEKIINWVGKYI